MNKLSEMIMRHGPPIGDVIEHHKREAELWRKRYEALTEMIAKNAFMHTHPAVTLMAEPESFKAGEELGVRKEREACAYLKKEIELCGAHPTDYEDGFWDALEKYEAAIRARGQA
jgi:hypothetical protein